MWNKNFVEEVTRYIFITQLFPSWNSIGLISLCLSWAGLGYFWIWLLRFFFQAYDVGGIMLIPLDDLSPFCAA